MKQNGTKKKKREWSVVWLPENGQRMRRWFPSETRARSFYRKLYLRPNPPLEQSLREPGHAPLAPKKGNGL